MRPVLLTALSVLALSACDFERVEETEVEEFRFEAGSERPRIEVRIEEGDVEIQGIEGARDIEAQFLKRAWSVDREAARRILARVEVSARGSEDGARFRFEGRDDSDAPIVGDLRTDLKIRVPREVELEIAVEDGRIQIGGIDGRVRAESGDGRIIVARSSGELRLLTEDGSITGRDLEAKIEARTGDGDVELDGAFTRLEAVTADGGIRIDCREWLPSTESWVARTADGAIRVLLPASTAADLDATVSDGRIVNRLPSFDGARRTESEGRVRGKIGGGGPLLFLSAMDGRIELDQK